MEKTLSLGALEELSENEIMVTEGGSIQGFFDWVCGATAAQKRAEKTYKTCRQNILNQINSNPASITDYPTSALDYFNIGGGPKGITGGLN